MTKNIKQNDNWELLNMTSISEKSHEFKKFKKKEEEGKEIKIQNKLTGS